jgi:glutamyl-tRNA synthetase
MHQPVRVRFAPSPTGALHIGGVRTALYNYLLAKKTGGVFILRIEDTDRTRFVEGAEEYIEKSLEWLGIKPEEGVNAGGEFGPYRQSDRKEIYRRFADELVDKGLAYYSFDTAEELENLRKQYETEGKTFKYDASTRLKLNNSLTQPESVSSEYLKSGNYVIRIKLPADEIIRFSDIIRGDVSYSTNDMDDKVMLKGLDNMPTYHLANVVDDFHMKISHVIRGEEWLPSTPLHVVLYRFLGWEAQMPVFAHLPLILRPDGKGKLSKRDGAKFGIPVFPLNFVNPNNKEDIALGFREWGFEPEAVINFLALLGWHPENDREMFSLTELVDIFDLERVSKSGARFDFEKARWFNQQYIMATSDAVLAQKMKPFADEAGYLSVSLEYLEGVAALMKERVEFVKEFTTKGYYFFKNPDYQQMMDNEGKDFEKKILKNWNADRALAFEKLTDKLCESDTFNHLNIKETVENFTNENNLKFGDVLPVLRMALSATLKGPGVFEMMELLGRDNVNMRLNSFFKFCSAFML